MSEEVRLTNAQIKEKYEEDIRNNNMIVINKIVQLVKSNNMKELHQFVLTQMVVEKRGIDKKTKKPTSTVYTNINGELLEALCQYLFGVEADITKQSFSFEVKGLRKDTPIPKEE